MLKTKCVQITLKANLSRRGQQRQEGGRKVTSQGQLALTVLFESFSHTQSFTEADSYEYRKPLSRAHGVDFEPLRQHLATHNVRQCVWLRLTEGIVRR